VQLKQFKKKKSAPSYSGSNFEVDRGLII